MDNEQRNVFLKILPTEILFDFMIKNHRLLYHDHLSEENREIVEIFKRKIADYFEVEIEEFEESLEEMLQNMIDEYFLRSRN